MRSTLGIGLPLVVLLIACHAPGQGSPTAVTARETQNVPSHGPGPTLPPLPTPFFHTFPPETDRGPSPSPSAPPDPALVDLIPTTIAGKPLQIISGRASDWGETGDMCGAFCPGEIQETARKVGVDPANATWAAGLVKLGSNAAVYIRAIRVPGAKSDLIAAWRAEMPGAAFLLPTEVRVGGRRATLLREPYPDPSSAIYVVLVGDVAYSVAEVPPPANPGQPSDRVVEAFSLLP